MNAKQRIKQLEKTSGAVGGDNTFRVFIVTPDGGAWTSDAAGKRTKYTTAEYAELQKKSDNIIRVIPASMDGDQ